MTGSKTKPARRTAKAAATEPPRKKRAGRRKAVPTAEGATGLAVAREAATAPSNRATLLVPKAPSGKLGIVVALMRRQEGATVTQMSEATGWQPHSVRGALAGALKRKHKLTIVGEPGESGRIYRIASEQTA